MLKNKTRPPRCFKGGILFLLIYYQYQYINTTKEKKFFMTDNFLRREVKILKALQDIEYREIAEYLEVKECSFYAWI